MKILPTIYLITLLAIALYYDIKYKKIKNITIIIFLFIAIEITYLTGSSIINLIINILITLLFTFFLFYHKILAAGDSKLLISISALLNPISKGPYSLLLMGIIFILFYIYAALKSIFKSKKEYWIEAFKKSIKEIPHYLIFGYMISPLKEIIYHQTKYIEITLLSLYIILSGKIKKLLSDKFIIFLFIIARTLLLPISLETLKVTFIYTLIIFVIKILNTIITLSLRRKVHVTEIFPETAASTKTTKKQKGIYKVKTNEYVTIKTESPFSIFITLGTLVYLLLQIKYIS